MRVFVFGDANADITVRWADAEKSIKRLPPADRRLVGRKIAESRRTKTDIECYLPKRDKGLSKFFDSLNPRVELGGCGAIKARTMALLGHDVVFFSWVGGDKNGRMILEGLSRAGVDVSHVIVKGKTCETYNLFDPRGARLAFSHWVQRSDLRGFIKIVKREKPDMVLLAGAHRIKRGLGYAKLPGAFVFTGSFADYTEKELAAKYEADFSGGILVANDAEVMQLSGAADPLSGLGFLPNNTIVMHGQDLTAVKRGCSIVVAGIGKLDRSKVVELTGIGDVWEAVFLSEAGNLKAASEARITASMKAATKAAKTRMLTGKFP